MHPTRATAPNSTQHLAIGDYVKLVGLTKNTESNLKEGTVVHLPDAHEVNGRARVLISGHRNPISIKTINLEKVEPLDPPVLNSGQSSLAVLLLAGLSDGDMDKLTADHTADHLAQLFNNPNSQETKTLVARGRDLLRQDPVLKDYIEMAVILLNQRFQPPSNEKK